MSHTTIMKTRETFYHHVKRFWDFRVVLGIFMLLSLPHCTECCWGKEAPKYGEMTQDYSLMVGDELVLNCSLNSHEVEINKKVFSVNSSQLILRHKGINMDLRYIKVIDDLTAQFRKPNANLSDSGIYLCQLSIPELASDHVVCSSKVNVGYSPGPVQNFKCISKFYKNLTCTWEVPNNGIQTTYTLFKRNYLFANYFNNPALQRCPEDTANNTYCQWRSDTDPPFGISEKNFTFELVGNNSLGISNETFTLNHDEILMPRSPEFVVMGAVNKKNISIQWSPPKKIHGIQQPPLMYQMWLEELIGEKETQVFDIGIDVTSYTIFGLEPHMLYNISLRCRSNSSDLWSPFVSIQTRTLSDVPYHVPEVIPEAFELHHYDGYRTVTLYWKPISSKYYNGEDFKYHIVGSEKNLPSNNMVPTTKSMNTTAFSITFTNLQKNISYSFRLYTMNKEGVSNSYKAIFVESQDKSPEPPEDITAISYDVGHYQMSWKPPSKNSSSIIDYVVFWCSSSKPWLSRCESPIQWLNTPLLENNVTLNLSDSSTNFQFAVVARTSTASSGMQWATCIVPSKAALGKIGNVFVDQENATSLKVTWRLDCPAQKAVVQKIEIDYCKVNEKQKCRNKKQSINILDSSLETYFIRNLIPFTNYSVIIRAYNQAGVASEDSDPKFQTTSQGAPSDPPQNVKVIAIPNAGLQVTWEKPSQPNGIITHYELKYNRNSETLYVNKDQKTFREQITGLMFYTFYNISIQAYVGHFPSPPSKAIIVQTDIGVPGPMDPPRVESVNSTILKVSWNLPLSPNGPINFYEILWKEMNNWNTSEKDDGTQTKIVEKALSTFIEMKCLNVEDGGIKYAFSIRAVNIKEKVALYGSLSDGSQVRACLLSQGLAMLIGVAIGGTLALAFVLLMVYKLIKWMNDKINQVKSITVRLPKGLDGPETNPLNNYENFKNGLLPQPLNNNNIGRLSYIADDYDKNRHGSGSSQYSYSSTDELLYKNGKCTKFARKPSGESSGCSSMSSNTAKFPMTSDSSTESDFMTPPSPDIAFQERNGYKGNLPIVMEGQDSLNSSSVATDIQQNKPMKSEEKNSSIADGVVLKVDQPYSKFGVSKDPGIAPVWWMNPLTIYNGSLSTSEPSVTDIKEPVTVLVPYSKVGLAKSSSNIVGLKQIDSNAGYSRFGVIATSNTDPSHLDLERRLLPSDLKSDEYSIKDLLEKYQGFNGKNVEKPDAGGDFFHIAPFLTSAHIPLETRMSEVHGDNGYIKFRRPMPKPILLKRGYIPFNELSNISNLMPAPSSLPTNNELQKVSVDSLPTADGNTQKNLYDVDLLSNSFPPKDNTFLTTDPEFKTSPVQKEVNGALTHEVVNDPKDFVRNDAEFTPTQLCGSDKQVSPSEDAMSDSASVVPNFHCSEAKMKPQSPDTSVNLRTNALPQNGYVSFAELWNLHNESDSSMPNAEKIIDNSSVEDTHYLSDPNWAHSTIFDAPKPSTDLELPSDSKVPDIGHKVHPSANSIPRCKFAPPHTEPQSLPTRTYNGFCPQQLVNFGPMIESEICEV